MSIDEQARTRLMEETRIEQVRTGVVSFNAVTQEVVLEVEVITRTPTLQLDLQIAEPPGWRRGRWGLGIKFNLSDMFQLPEGAEMPIRQMLRHKEKEPPF